MPSESFRSEFHQIDSISPWVKFLSELQLLASNGDRLKSHLFSRSQNAPRATAATDQERCSYEQHHSHRHRANRRRACRRRARKLVNRHRDQRPDDRQGYGVLPLIAAVTADATKPASSNETTPHVCASMPQPSQPKAVRVCAMLVTATTVIQSRNMLKA